MTDDLSYDPRSLTVEPGDTVVFETVGGGPHTVTAYEESIPEEADCWASGGFDSEQAARDNYLIQGESPGL